MRYIFSWRQSLPVFLVIASLCVMVACSGSSDEPEAVVVAIPTIQPNLAIEQPTEAPISLADPATLTPIPTIDVPQPPRLMLPEVPGTNGEPTLADFWEGTADFTVEVADTGLPMGESETIIMSNGEYWSYVHASDRSAGVVDQCGAPVEFPGCTVIYKSFDQGYSFSAGENPTCQFACTSCPCTTDEDYIDQQQYPDVHYDGNALRMTYEYRGRTIFTSSTDGQTFSGPQEIEQTGHWHLSWRPCPDNELIGSHPFVPYNYDCLSGGPPGIYTEGDTVYVFVAIGQNPAGLGCFKGNVVDDPTTYTRCENNPLFEGAPEYGPIEERGEPMNQFFDFRYTSSSEIMKVGDRYYMMYEGVRGPGPFDAGDTQFGLGLARSLTGQLDGKWEKYSLNPILVDLPANIGIGHADLIVQDGRTILYTSLDGVVRSRLVLVWK